MANGPTLDGIAQPAPQPPSGNAAAPQPPQGQGVSTVRKWKGIVVGAVVFLYTIFALWCLLLLSVLPSQQDLSALVMIGTLTCVIAALVFLGVGALMAMHIMQSKAAPKVQRIAFIKLAAILIPGLTLSALTPVLIMREPSLSIDITQPAAGVELVAPLSMTFDVTRTVDILTKRGFSPIKYLWDVNGDRKVDQETLDPTITATFEREGIYGVSVIMQGGDGTTRTATRRFAIARAVFSVAPDPPVIDRPVVFSLAHLFPDASAVETVAWDFDEDGQPDEQTEELQASYTFMKTGTARVRAVVQLANKTQVTYERSVEVQDPPQLPYPVTIRTEPSVLIGTAPFAALFEVQTSEPIFNVQWNFGDGQKGEGQRVTHTFANNGSYAVVARVRSQSGVVAEVTSVVKVTSRLNLPDLRYEGTPAMQGSKIVGEVPLTIDLKAVTQKPFVSFSWEAPDATEVGSTTDKLQAIYRRPGTYTITLIAQDLENHVLRQPITVEVRPPSAVVSIRMEPETGVAPLTVQFDASESSIPGQDITGFIWSFGDGTPEEYGGAVTQHLYKTPGKYVVNLRVTTANGSQQTSNKTVTVRAATMQARILASRLSGVAPLTVLFDGGASTGTVQTYLWDFGDGTQNTGPEVEHTFLEPGTYTVQLTVADETGKTAITTLSISVE